MHPEKAKFLSTPSGWRATIYNAFGVLTSHDFYPRPPGGGRLHPSGRLAPACYFYPRPPGGGRPRLRPKTQKQRRFLSTPSGWRATQQYECKNRNINISIHALRVEGDKINSVVQNVVAISIHALRVEGDALYSKFGANQTISIHALRVEGDSKNGQNFRLFLRKREKNLPL